MYVYVSHTDKGRLCLGLYEHDPTNHTERAVSSPERDRVVGEDDIGVAVSVRHTHLVTVVL